MSHKTLAKIAIIMVVVFGAIVLSYPLLFGPSQDGPKDLKVNPSSN